MDLATHYETAHLSESLYLARREHLDEIAKVQQQMTWVRDEMARLCQYWGVDAVALDDVVSLTADLANDLLGAIRREYERQ